MPTKTPKNPPRTVSKTKLDAPKTPKVKSNIGSGYKADPNRPRAKKK